MFDRWRNSHGFGVHSPFGYQLVERVVRPCRGYAYYAYDDIDRACSSSEHRIADKAKMLLRLVCFLRPRKVFLPDYAHKAFFIAMKSPDSKIRFIRNADKAVSDCDIIATRGDEVPLEDLRSFMSLPDRTLLIKDAPQNWCDSVFEAMNEGIMIRGRRNAICISRSGMQKVSYLMYI